MRVSLSEVSPRALGQLELALGIIYDEDLVSLSEVSPRLGQLA